MFTVACAGPKARRRWWQRRRVTQQTPPAGGAAAPDQAPAKPGTAAAWPPGGVPSPFQDASQQSEQHDYPQLVFADNPLLLSRKQSDSASSLRVAGGSSLSVPTSAKRRVSISEHPDEAGLHGKETGVDSLGVAESRRVDHETAGSSGVDAGAGVGGAQEGGPAGGPGEIRVPGEIAEVSPGEMEGSGSRSGGSESGESDLAQTASAELGGVVIGIMPDSELSHSARLVRPWVAAVSFFNL